jgi:hypothetical protein
MSIIHIFSLTHFLSINGSNLQNGLFGVNFSSLFIIRTHDSLIIWSLIDPTNELIHDLILVVFLKSAINGIFMWLFSLLFIKLFFLFSFSFCSTFYFKQFIKFSS